MKLNSWIEAHNHMYRYFGGVTKLLVPDNLKPGVTKHTKDDVILNRSNSDMADYYGLLLSPQEYVLLKISWV